MPCVAKVRNPTDKAPTQKIALSKGGGRRPSATSEGRLSLTRRERQMEAFESQRCFLHKERDHSREDHVAKSRISFVGSFFGTHARTYQESHANSGSKDCSEQRWREIANCQCGTRQKSKGNKTSSTKQ